MDDLTQISVMLTTQRFLIGQLYKNFFLENPEARKKLPESMIEAARDRPTERHEISEDRGAELRPLVVQELESFFADVESRVQIALARAPQ